KSTANSIFVDQDCHPQTIAVIKTRARSLGYEVIVADPYRDLEPYDFLRCWCNIRAATAK
ncbi:MAG: hypothetical protein Q7U28_13165, partial [Aquabacterium sp.]|nr:hypothetical protein [Aquabacterium sp.]